MFDQALTSWASNSVQGLRTGREAQLSVGRGEEEVWRHKSMFWRIKGGIARYKQLTREDYCVGRNAPDASPTSAFYKLLRPQRP